MKSSDAYFARVMSKRILRFMLNCFPAIIELHGYGKDSIKGVEQVMDKLDKWANVMNIKTGKMFGEKYIQGFLKRREKIYGHYKSFKEKAENRHKSMKKTQIV